MELRRLEVLFGFSKSTMFGWGGGAGVGYEGGQDVQTVKIW